jgi:hypothetical protein
MAPCLSPSAGKGASPNAGACVASRGIREAVVPDGCGQGRAGHPRFNLGFWVGAGEGNRTLMTSLEGWGSAIELRPRVRHGMNQAGCAQTAHRQRTGTAPAAGVMAWGQWQLPGGSGIPAAQAEHGKLRIGLRDVAQLG